MTAPNSRKAFILGGTSGIGRSIIEHLCSAGWTVCFSGRNEERGSIVAKETGAQFLRADARSRGASDWALIRVLDQFGGAPDLFVSCAAIVFNGPLSNTPTDIFSEIVEVNLTAPFRYSRGCFEAMRERGTGVIIHIVSDAALIGLHHLPAYSISKAGLLAMSEALAAEAVVYGIRVNAICPGATHPGVQSTVDGYEDHVEDDANWGPAPSGRHGRGSDIAQAVLWLASDAAEHVAGATLRIDGAASAAMRESARA